MVVSGGQTNKLVTAGNGQERRITEHDWSKTSLGARHTWSPRLRTLVELMIASVQPMFIMWGAERTWLYNDAFIPIAGRKHPSSLGMPSCEVWAEAWGDLQPLYDRVYSGEADYSTGFRVGLDRGGVVEDAYFDFSHTPVRDDGGNVIGLFGVCTETTVRTLSDRQTLASIEDERDRLFELSRDLFGVATFDGSLKTVNPAWSRQLGHSQDFLLSHPFADIIHPDDLAITGEVVDTLRSGQPVHQFLVRLLKEDGTAMPFAWSAVPDATPGSDFFYTVGRDISDDLAAASELKQAQEALRQSQKMEAVGQLTGGIAHDFNNLLGGISGSLEMLQKRVEQGRYSEIDKYIFGAQAAAKRAAALTHRLLAFSRRQTLDPKPTEANVLVAGIAELVRGTVGPQIDTQITYANDLWAALVDQNQLENALLNLCINARDAMPDGGTLKIETANHTFVGQEAEERKLTPGQYISVCVTDDGTGMPADVIERAFDPFFTTKPIGQGTGLGLSMIYGFVRQSGGQVGIFSEVGKGTTICMYLPRHMGAAAVDVSGPDNRSAPAGGGATVLIIDDEPAIRMLVTEVLQDLGYRTLSAEDGPSGMTLLDENPQIDLVITDVGLPGGMNGRQVADAARVARPELRVLFITGYAKSALSDGNLERGMDVLTKPFTLEAVALKVAGLLGQADGRSVG